MKKSEANLMDHSVVTSERLLNLEFVLIIKKTLADLSIAEIFTLRKEPLPMKSNLYIEPSVIIEGINDIVIILSYLATFSSLCYPQFARLATLYSVRKQNAENLGSLLQPFW